MQRSQTLDRQAAIERLFGAAQQRSAEPAACEEIIVLLSLDHALDGLQRLPALVAKLYAVCKVARLGFRQKLQFMFTSPADELAEIDRRIVFAEIVVKTQRGILRHDSLHLGTNRVTICIG